MINYIDKKIKEYSKIIILRHKNPDMDAIGSQVGLYYLIKDNYPKKQVYITGDKNKYDKENLMMDLDNQVFEDALVIIVDVAVSNLISDDRYHLAKQIIIIDHHENETNIDGAKTLIDSSYSSASELITNIFKELDYYFSPKASSYLFAGMITDTGRFMWMKKPEQVFKTAAFLVKHKAEINELYNFLYTEPLALKRLKAYLQSQIVYEDGIAYLKNDKDFFETFDVDFFTISRGMVNLASGIKEIKIWLNFTYNQKDDTVVGEFRSRGINIVEIAKSFGGGGHANACGATLKDFDEADQVIKAYKDLLRGIENGC